MKKSYNKRTRLIPINLEDGTSAKIDANSLSGWDVHHGTTAKGAKVNSLNSKRIGNSIVLRDSESDVAFSVGADEFEVAAVQLLKSQGYEVKPPSTDS